MAWVREGQGAARFRGFTGGSTASPAEAQVEQAQHLVAVACGAGGPAAWALVSPCRVLSKAVDVPGLINKT